MEKTNVLFVCLGNICRSPMAEGLFLHKVKMAGLENQFVIDSCGTSGWHIGELPDKRMRAVAEAKGIHLPSKARQIAFSDVERFHYILAMDGTNLKNVDSLIRSNPQSISKAFKMRDFDLKAKGLDVPDPYYGSDRGFEDVFEMLDRSNDQLLKFILQERGGMRA